MRRTMRKHNIKNSSIPRVNLVSLQYTDRNLMVENIIFNGKPEPAPCISELKMT